jgi:predicted DCC family thiol-disulfide oxidoreductase YuxK
VNAGPVVLYDGDCGVCSSGVQLILRRERLHTLRFAALGGDFGLALLERHPELRGVDSLLWVETGVGGTPERVFVRSDAVFHAAAYLGGPWRMVGIFRLVPRRLRDAAYDLFARNRHRIPVGAQSCLRPDAELRERFLS